MTCAKKFGPGALLVNQETVFNQSTDLGRLISAQSATFGALNREVIDNTELRMNRGQSESFKGAQSEISWEVVIAATASADDGIGFLWWAAGRDYDKLANNSICGRSLQLTRFDRDGLLCEVLNGCIVQNVTYAFSATDLCTITFSGVAASKFELNGIFSGANITWAGTEEDTVTVAGHVNSSYKMLNIVPTYTPTGIYAKCYKADGTFVDTVEIEEVTNNAYILGVNGQTTPPTIDKIILEYNTADIEIESVDIISPADWILKAYVNLNWVTLPVQSAEITLETGLSFGELTVNNAMPSEIVSANNSVTGSFTMYLDDTAEKLFKIDSLPIQIADRNENIIAYVPKAKLNTKPAYELAPDSAASGDFEFTGWAANANNYVLTWTTNI